jgi:hypothetical protein
MRATTPPPRRATPSACVRSSSRSCACGAAGVHATWRGMAGACVVGLDMHDERHEGMGVHIRQRDVADGYHPPPDDLVLSTSIQASCNLLTLPDGGSQGYVSRPL